jgi:hypothetical protein
MALQQHGRGRRRLRLPDEEKQDPLVSTGGILTGLRDEADSPHGNRRSATARSGAGGDGQAAAAAGASNEVPRLQLERVQLGQERPELNKEALRRNRWLALASAAASGIGALADSPGLAKVGAGLSESFAAGNQRRRNAFFEELSNFRDRRQEVRTTNQQIANREREANFQTQLEDRRDRREHAQSLEELEKQQRLERAQIKWKRGRPLTEEEKRELEVAETNARANLTRALQSRQGSDDDLEAAPTSVDGVDREIQLLERYKREGIEETNTFGEPYRRELKPKELQQINNRIRKLRRHRQKLSEDGEQPFRNQNGGRDVPEGDLIENRDTFMNRDPSSRSGKTQSGRTSGGQVSQGRASRQRVENALENVRSIAQERSSEAALRYIRDQVQSGQLSEREANVLLDELGVE